MEYVTEDAKGKKIKHMPDGKWDLLYKFVENPQYIYTSPDVSDSDRTWALRYTRNHRLGIMHRDPMAGEGTQKVPVLVEYPTTKLQLKRSNTFRIDGAVNGRAIQRHRKGHTTCACCNR